MNLRKAAEQALEALSEYEKSYPAVADAFKPLRAALAEEVMQRLTDVQQEIEAALQSAGTPQTDRKPEPVGDEWEPCVKLPVTVHVRAQRNGETHVSTREGITPIKPDDLIMRGVSGEEYPIGREIFERTYQRGEAPPQRKPLTDAEIKRLYDSLPSKYTLAMFARAIERAHGIGGEE